LERGRDGLLGDRGIESSQRGERSAAAHRGGELRQVCRRNLARLSEAFADGRNDAAEVEANDRPAHLAEKNCPGFRMADPAELHWRCHLRGVEDLADVGILKRSAPRFVYDAIACGTTFSITFSCSSCSWSA